MDKTKHKKGGKLNIKCHGCGGSRFWVTYPRDVYAVDFSEGGKEPTVELIGENNGTVLECQDCDAFDETSVGYDYFKYQKTLDACLTASDRARATSYAATIE